MSILKSIHKLNSAMAFVPIAQKGISRRYSIIVTLFKNEIVEDRYSGECEAPNNQYNTVEAVVSTSCNCPCAKPIEIKPTAVLDSIANLPNWWERQLGSR